MISRKIIISALGVMLSVSIIHVYANTEQMTMTLQRISHVLQQINPLINEAQTEQGSNARIKFRFDLLRADIAKIQSGITEQLDRVTIQPRTVQPLKGDYLKQTKKIKRVTIGDPL